MEMSRRARRMERHHRIRRQSPLNLVSLMDIFTILVFFLLVNSSTTPQLPSNKELTLPTSVARKAPEETLAIVVTKTDILVQGRKIGEVSSALAQEGDIIEGLANELTFLSGGVVPDQPGRQITILGDESIPYDLIRKIMATCQQINFTNIAFAANQVANRPY